MAVVSATLISPVLSLIGRYFRASTTTRLRVALIACLFPCAVIPVVAHGFGYYPFPDSMCLFYIIAAILVGLFWGTWDLSDWPGKFKAVISVPQSLIGIVISIVVLAIALNSSSVDTHSALAILVSISILTATTLLVSISLSFVASLGFVRIVK